MIKGLRLEALRIIEIIIGVLLVAFAYAAFYIPNGFVSSGVGGIGLVLNKVTGFSVGSIILAINIPLFIMSYFFVNLKFFIQSLLTMVLLAFSIDMLSSLNIVIPVEDNITLSVVIGILVGVGMGLVFRGNSSFGGSDIIAVMLRKKFAIDVGHTILAFDFIVLSLSLFIYSIDVIIASFLAIFIYSQILNKILLGFNPKVSLIINTAKVKEVKESLFILLKREITELKSESTFVNNQGTLYMVTPQTSLEVIKEEINRIDSEAFVTVTQTQVVMGLWRNNTFAKNEK